MNSTEIKGLVVPVLTPVDTADCVDADAFRVIRRRESYEDLVALER